MVVAQPPILLLDAVLFIEGGELGRTASYAQRTKPRPTALVDGLYQGGGDGAECVWDM